PRHCQGELRPELYGAWHLVGRQTLPAKGDQIRAGDAPTVGIFEHHIGPNGLTAIGVRNPDDRRPPHGRGGVEHLLPLTRPDLEAGRVDHVLPAVDDPEVPLVVHDGDVTRAQPAVRENAGRLLRTPPVPAHHLGPPYEELTGLAGIDIGPRVEVDNPRIGVG